MAPMIVLMLLVMMVEDKLLHEQHKLSCMLKPETLWEYVKNKLYPQIVRRHPVKLAVVEVSR